MRIQSFLSRISVLSVSLVMGVSAVSSQSYYDDDIYYDASKAPKKTEKIDKARRDSKSAVRADASRQSQQASQYYYDGAAYVPWNNVGDYQSADSYSVDGTSTRDVDEYNRRYTGSQASSSQCDSISLEQFEEMSNTKNLARFHDSSAAREAYADDVDESAAYSNDAYTYSAQPQTTLNINVVGGYPYYPYYGYSSPWYWNSWGYYDPWWGWSGPSWSWGWGPSFAWGPSWGWGPSWSWGPSWGVSSRPHYTSPGAYAPNRTHASSGTYRGNSYRNGAGAGSPSTIGNSLGRRPSGSQGSNRNGVTQSARPGYREPISRPNTSGTVNGASSGAQRGRAGYESRQSGINNNNSSTRYNSNTYRNNSNSNNSNSWNSNSSRGRSGSFGGSSSGSSRGGFSGGGVSRGSSGGGGHRGR